ncbi:MAG TPA: hypothetical protein VG318_07235 [Actinomycetota bacterium]|nr:hypothetical protein [Actinomycetota bacterium]
MRRIAPFAQTTQPSAQSVGAPIGNVCEFVHVATGPGIVAEQPPTREPTVTSQRIPVMTAGPTAVVVPWVAIVDDVPTAATYSHTDAIAPLESVAVATAYGAAEAAAGAAAAVTPKAAAVTAVIPRFNQLFFIVAPPFA